MKRFLLVLFCNAFATVLTAATIAETALELSQRSAGVICVPAAQSATVPLELAEKSSCIVHVLYDKRDTLAKAESTFYEAGLLGRRIYPEYGHADEIPLVNQMVDLLVLDNLTTKQLTALSLSEIERVLAPSRGVALLHSNELSTSVLQTFAKQSSLIASSVQNDTGTWLVLKKGMPLGSDDWSHIHHGPDNNPVSHDQIFKRPVQVQYLAKPYHHIKFSTSAAVIANGRAFVMGRPDRGGDKFYSYTDFAAFSIYNGQLLWTKLLPEKYPTGYSTVIAHEDELLVLMGATIVVLDAETGTEKRIFNLDAGGHGRWMGMQGGTLLVLVGSPELSEAFPKKTDVVVDSFEMNNNIVMAGNQLIAYDWNAQQRLWKTTVPDLVHARMMAMDKDAVYCATNKTVMSFTLKSGTERWQTESPEMKKLLTMKVGGKRAQSLWKSDRGIVIKGAYGLVGSAWRAGFAVFESATGRVLWQKAGYKNGRLSRHFILGEELWDGAKRFDITTGTPIAYPVGGKPMASGCGKWTATPFDVIGMCGFAFDRVESERVDNQYTLHKPPCEQGSLVAGGVYFSAAGPCKFCPLDNRGYLGLSPQEEPYKYTERLEVLGVKVPNSSPVDRQDWTNYAANNQHSGFSPVSISEKKPMAQWSNVVSHPLWTTETESKYSAEHGLTQAISVGGSIFVAGSDGMLRCLAVADGTTLWSTFCGGKIYFSPSFFDGAVYVASGDGYVYCINAQDGTKRWRYRVEEQTRKRMIYGHLSSPCPVVSGILIHEGVLYAAAGIANEAGAALIALDAQTGSLKWEQTELNGQYQEHRRGGRTPSGGLTVAHGQLWMSALYWSPVAFNLETGVMATLPDSQKKHSNGYCGEHIGVLPNGTLLYGGWRLQKDQSNRHFLNGRGGRISFQTVDNAGQAVFPEVTALPKVLQMPVWDDTQLITARLARQHITAWDMKKLSTWIETSSEKYKDKKYPNHKPSAYELPTPKNKKNEFQAADVPMQEWQSGYDVNGLALSRNAVLMLAGFRDEKEMKKQHALLKHWKVIAINRTEGDEIWSIDLPSEPLYNGISLTRDGAILVVLRSGEVLCYK